jgi:hypothetical protein
LVTWLPVTVRGAVATVRGQRHQLTLTIEAPANAHFALDNWRAGPQRVKRRSSSSASASPCRAPATVEARVRMAITSLADEGGTG